MKCNYFQNHSINEISKYDEWGEGKGEGQRFIIKNRVNVMTRAVRALR